LIKQSPNWKAVGKNGNIWVTLTISATHATIQDDGIMMPLSMAVSFMRWMKEAARTAGMPQRMATFWLILFALHQTL
jgi:hypothetical protein